MHSLRRRVDLGVRVLLKRAIQADTSGDCAGCVVIPDRVDDLHGLGGDRKLRAILQRPGDVHQRADILVLDGLSNAHCGADSLGGFLHRLRHTAGLVQRHLGDRQPVTLIDRTTNDETLLDLSKYVSSLRPARRCSGRGGTKVCKGIQVGLRRRFHT